MNFFVCSRKHILISLLILVIISASLFTTVKVSYTSKTPKQSIVVAIDPGHGGRDGGCVGKITKVKESDLALAISKKLKKQLSTYGYKVILTRENENGLYSDGKNKKLQDMEARKKIINDNASNCVVSIHLNSFPSGDAQGAQAFFTSGDDNSSKFAESIQQQLTLQIPNARKVSKSGDFYILQCSSVPSVLVECGYLSNEEEEQLLITDAHQEKVAYAIFCGILKFFNYSFS